MECLRLCLFLILCDDFIYLCGHHQWKLVSNECVWSIPAAIQQIHFPFPFLSLALCTNHVINWSSIRCILPCKKAHWTEHNDFKFYRHVVCVVCCVLVVENVFSAFAWLLIESQLTNAYRSYFIGIALDTLESNLLLHCTHSRILTHTHIIDGGT